MARELLRGYFCDLDKRRYICSPVHFEQRSTFLFRGKREIRFHAVDYISGYASR